MLPVIDLAPRGEDGVVASVEETESSASSTSSGRHSAGLPIVGPPRGLLAIRALQEENPFQVFSCPHKIKKNGEGKQNQKTRPTNKHRDKGRYSHLSRRGTIQISRIHSIQNRVGTTKEE